MYFSTEISGWTKVWPIEIYVENRGTYLKRQGHMHTILSIAFTMAIFGLSSTDLYAACGGTVRTWDSGGANDNWNTANNWNPNNVPNSATEDAVIIAGERDTQVNQNITVGCVEVLSGYVTDRNNRSLTVVGDYFKNHNSNTVYFDSNSFRLIMAGTAAQTLENVDPISNVRISNDTSVTFTHPFTITNELDFGGGWSGTLYINEDLYLDGGQPVVIPSGGKVVIGSGAVVTTFQNWTINGTLEILPGGQLRPGNNEVVNVTNSGTLILSGAPGNPAVIASQGFNDTITVTMDGILNAEYFLFSGMSTVGVDVDGVVQKLDYGQFSSIPNNGYYLTISAASTLPSTMTGLSFANNLSSTNARNFNGTAYNNTVVSLADWSGSVGGAANETDPNSMFTWGTQESTEIKVQDFSNPPFTINQNNTQTLSTFAFSLNQADTATDITSIKITMSGTASTSDIQWIQVFRDGAASRNCAYNAGNDVDLTGQVSLAGSPPSYTVSVTPGDISTSSDSDDYCIHVRVRTTTNAQDAKTIQFGIVATDDVVNSQGYPFSSTASPPVYTTPATAINGDAVSRWEGSNNTNWNTGGNWTGPVPSATRDCQVGPAVRDAVINIATANCQNAALLTGGTVDWANTTRNLNIDGSLEVQSGYNFNNAASGPGRITMGSTTSQGLKMETEFPGDLYISNTGAVGNDIVGVSANSIIGGDVYITNGVLRINNPYTLTVKGDLTCQTGGALTIEAGATLAMGDGTTLDIQSGCTLTIVGSPSSVAKVTSDLGTSAYNVTVDGTIAARYYQFDHLDTDGVSIGSGATIDGTNHLQNGAFQYPVNNTTRLLSLARQIPTNTLDGMNFSLAGSSATGTVNIDTTGATAGTLTLDSYAGDLAGATYDTDPAYLLSWLGAVNTIDISQDATSPASVDAGSTYNMGRWKFSQTFAGASYNDTDITSFRVTLTGTGSSNDVSDVKLYYDSNCDGTAGSLLGSGTLSGNPASITFAIGAGQAVIEADSMTPPERCLYVEYSIAGAAIDGNTVGATLSSSTHFTNSEDYLINSGTQPPITLGTPATINGSALTIWTGATSTNWFTASNWSSGVPSATINCQIDSSSNNPTITSATGVCKNIEIGNGTLTLANGTGAALEIYGGFENTGTINQNDGVIRLRDDGVTAVNQGVSSTSTLSALTFNKTAGGEIYVNSNSLTVGTLTFPGGSDFTFRVPNGKTLQLNTSTTVTAGTLSVEAGGVLKLANSTTLTVNTPGVFRIVGDSSTNAIVTNDSGANSYNIVINTGEIEAQYYTLDHLGVAGLSIESGSTIDPVYHLQNGSFICPPTNSSTLLSLKRQVPTNTMNDMIFDLGSCSGTTGTVNINTTGAASGTLEIDGYSGDVAGPTFDTDPTYLVDWVGAENTIDISASTTSGGMLAGTTYVMGRYSFSQSLAGSFSDADLTLLKLTLSGTAAVSDISEVRVFYDSDCDSASGVQIGSGTFSGSPATINFNLNSNDVTIPSDLVTPPSRCVYVEYDVAAGAVDGRTAGVEIAISSHVTNDQGWDSDSGIVFPLSLGTPRTITGSTVTTWTGAVSTVFNVAGNWSSGVPTSSINCVIPDVANDPVVSTTEACNQLDLQAGAVLTIGGAGTLDIHGDLVNSGGSFSITGNLRMAGTGTNIVNSSSAIGSISFNKTSGVVQVGASALQIDSLTFPAGSTFILKIPDTYALILPNGATFTESVTLDIEPGGTVKVGDGQTLNFNGSSVLEMVGTASKRSILTSTQSTYAYNVVVNTGTINARYYTFDHLDTAGVSIESGAGINATNHLQDGEFTYPVNNSGTLLFLKRQVPTNTMDNMNFDLNGSGATGTTNINTTGASAGTLTLDAFTGDLAGSANDIDPTYLLDWTGALNTLDITLESSTPGSVDAGSTYQMGSFNIVQTLAGSYSDVDITSLKLTMTGTAPASDIDTVRIYFDPNCDETAGALIGSGSFVGAPASKTFTIAASDATIPFHATTPPARCLYVEMDIASDATAGNTVGVKIQSASDVVTDLGYEVATTLPLTLGSPATINGSTNTNWLGNVSTDWFVAGNWSAGVPDSTKSCQITNVANDPNINGGSGTAVCLNYVNAGGVVTFQNGTGASLEVYGNYETTGTTNQNDGTIRMEDGGAGSNHNFSTNTTVTNLTFDKTSGGEVRFINSGTVNTLTIPGGSSFDFVVKNGVTLTLPNGVSIPSGTFTIEGGGTLEVGNGQNISVTGGSFRTTGVNDSFGPQSISNKGKVTVSGAGRWGFSASSGSVSLTGFILEYLNTSGVNLSGSADLLSLDGGQFTQLSNTAGVRALQINKSSGGTLTETNATNVGWMWSGANSICTAPCTPASGSSYYLVYAPNCGGVTTLNFSGWFGDFTTGKGGGDEVVTEDKIFDTTESGTCDVVIAASASPVSLVSFGATPYDSSASLDWVTGSELDHVGFHVFRSTNSTSGYVQVNSEIIRNNFESASHQGTYRFIDTDLANETTYYYKIQDVAANGNKVMHGPVSVTPLAGLGSPPPDNSNTSSDTSDPDANDGNDINNGPISQPGMKDLGNGIHIISQTQNSIILEIVPPTESWSVSPLNGSYEDLEIPGYVAFAETGKPKLMEKVILIEVEDSPTTASILDMEINEDAPVSHNVASVPLWTVDGNGVLQPSWSMDSNAYSTNAYFPGQYVEVESEVKDIVGRKYVEVRAIPIQFNPVTGDTVRASKILVEIGLSGYDSSHPPVPGGDLADSPAAVEGTLKIRYKTAGMYELEFDDMNASGVGMPFEGLDTGELRMFYHGEEIPIEILSADSVFGSGDSIRFYGEYVSSLEDSYDEVVLAGFNLQDSPLTALRIESVNADPTGQPDSTVRSGFSRVRLEEDTYAVFDFPLGDFADHLFWERIYLMRGGLSHPPAAASFKDIQVDLNYADNSSGAQYTVQVEVAGRPAYSRNPKHHLVFWVNSIPYPVYDEVFQDQSPRKIIFQVPAEYFFSGSNTIRVQVYADHVAPNDYDMVDINSLTVDYKKLRVSDSGIAIVENRTLNENITVTGFDTASVNFYDVSRSTTRIHKLQNVDVNTYDAGVSYEARFFAQLIPGEEDGGRLFYGVEDGSFKTPDVIAMSWGARESLKDTANGADFLVIGHRDLLNSAQDLVDKRRMEGLRVKEVRLEQIYAEFSNGRVSSQGIKDFVDFARVNWRAPSPKYLLFLGDATYDTRDRLGYGGVERKMPVPLHKGMFMDYAHDNWFVQGQASLPYIAVGRIPSSDPNIIYSYVQKLLDYESGQLAPLPELSRKATFISDKELYNEGFGKDSEKLADALQISGKPFSTANLDRSAASDAVGKQVLIDEFENAPLLMTYIGHGAEDRWASADYFTTSDAKNLDNERLPMVVAFNCLNSLYYDPNPAMKSLGEEMIFNSDGGAIAFWGSTTMTVPSNQINMGKNFMSELSSQTSNGYTALRIGELFLNSKIKIGDGVSSLDTMRSWTLFGDPTMKIPMDTFTEKPEDSGGDGSGSGGGGCGSIGPVDGTGGMGFGRLLAFLLLFLLPMALIWNQRKKMKRVYSFN